MTNLYSFRYLAAVATLMTAAIPTLQAQDGAIFRDPIASISVNAQHQVKISPDRATINISVQTRANTAAAAAADNAKKQNTVLAALRSLGIPNEQLSTTNYSVQPEYTYPQNQAPKVTGYTVTNTIVADLRDITMVGKVVDAALGAGANMISSLDFYASNTEAARREALNSAIAQARAEADVAARAAGGTLGDLLDMNVSAASNPAPMPRVMYKAAMAADESTPINAGQETVSVSVSTRWRFVSVKR